MGDPAGVGAEVILGSVPDLPPGIELTIFGDSGTLKDAADALARSGARGPDTSRELTFSSITVLASSERRFGNPNRLTGEASYRFAVAALMAVKKGEADALVTAPISKKWLMAAGHNYPGHTEMLAEMTGAKRHAMMLAAPSLRVVPVTTHIPYADVPRALTRQKIFDVIELTHESLIHYFGVEKPRIACAGLNPHAGEGGAIGREELEIIAPAIDDARLKGIDVAGPLPGDAVFAKRDAYDAIVCMYHDQALGPLKALHFDEGVNLTIGLPIIRTSPDHGTAFDIAGKGIAKPSSMLAAMLLAASIVRRRRGVQLNAPAVTQ
jgi:4-hydroxythreonine-4-phosphate dehydrogenase